jgi:hypothetical protein
MKFFPRSRLHQLLILTAMVGGFTALGIFSLPWFLASPILPPDQVMPADVIVHWVTMSQSRADDYVAALYRQSKAKKIVCVSMPISWDVYAADFTRQHLVELGIPAENLASLHLPLEACSAPNDRRIAQYIKSQGWQRAIVVIDPVSAGNQLEKYFRQQGLVLSITCVSVDRDELLHNWWKTHWKIQWITKSAFGVVLDSVYAECR